MQVSYRPGNRRQLITGLDTRVQLLGGGSGTVINFDNAATTPPLKSVIQAINEFAPWYSSIHRGAGHKSQHSTRCYEAARESVLGFVGADPNSHVAIFVKNTTEGINKLAYRLYYLPDSRTTVICTGMEHHSNDLPWRDKFDVEYVTVNNEGCLCLDDLQNKLQQLAGKVRLVTVTGASNVTGIVNPIHDIAQLAHQYGAEIMVDGAQLVPHRSINMLSSDDPRHLDYLVFSAHKMYAPFGIGVLVANQNTFIYGCSECVGGGTVEKVTHDMVIWSPPPEKDEAGTPNVMGTVALNAAINTLLRLSMDTLANEETELATYARKKIQQLPALTMYGSSNPQVDRLGIISFNIDGLPHSLVATILALEYGIAVRNGCFCAQPYVKSLVQPTNTVNEPVIDGMVRVSLGLYNTPAEVDILSAALKTICNERLHYKKRYQLDDKGDWQPLPL